MATQPPAPVQTPAPASPLTKPAPRNVAPRFLHGILVSLTVLSVIALIPALAMSSFSFVAFNTPNTTNNLAVWFLVIAVLTFPIMLFAAIFVPWIFYRRERFVSSLFTAFLPLINLAIIAGLFYFADRITL